MTAFLPPFFELQFFDSNGIPLAGGQLYSYAAGTTTPLATYTDSTAGTPNANPIILDSAGRCSMWLGNAVYKFNLLSSVATGSVQQPSPWPIDNVQSNAGYALLSDLASTTTGKGDALIEVKQPFTGSVGRTQHDFNAQFLYAEDFGAVGDGTTNDTAAIQAGLDALTAGGTLFLANKSYLVDNLTMTKNYVRLQFSPATVLYTNTATADTITVSGTHVTIDGGGTGRIDTKVPSWDGTNTAWTYAVIDISGAYCTISNLCLANVRRVGIGFRDTENGIVRSCHIDNNYPSASWTGVETVNFGITIDPGTTGSKGNYLIQDNVIRTAVQGIFVGNFGTSTICKGLVITGNVFEGCLNHGCYLDTGTGPGAVIDGNAFNNCAFPIVCYGSYNVVSGNSMYTDATGGNQNTISISMRDPFGCIVTGNTMIGDVVSGGVVISFDNVNGQAAATNTVSNNICSNNVINVQANTGNAIRMGNTTNTTTAMDNNLVFGNRIIAKGLAASGVILLSPAATVVGKGNRVVNNDITIKGDTYGIAFHYQIDGYLAGNTIHWEAPDPGSAKTNGLIELFTATSTAVTHNMLTCVAAQGTANDTIRGIWENTGSDYNIIKDNVINLTSTLATCQPIVHTGGAHTITKGNVTANLAALTSGTVAVTVGTASTTVTNANVTADSIIVLTPSDSGGGKLMANPGIYYTTVAGTSFTVLTADGTNAAQTSSFKYSIQ